MKRSVQELEQQLREVPVLVTRAEVLDHFAKLIDERVAGLRIGQLLSADPNPDERHRQMTALWKEHLPAADLQIAAAKSAAELMRNLAREDRIIAARADAERAKREPSRG